MDSKVKTQQRKQGFNNKERRSTNNNNNNVNNKKRSTQEDKPTQQPRRPRIQLRTPIDQIKLNEVQSEKIKELNEKLHELGEAVAPSEKDHTLKLEKLEKRINQIKGNIDTYRHMIDEEYAKRDSYVSKHSGIAPNALNQIQSSLNELYEKKSQIEKDIQENNDKHSKLQVQLRDIRSKSGIKNQEEALAKIDQIDHRIEVETLTSPQLRKLISERDRIFTVMKELVSADKLIKEDDDCRKRVNQLYEEKKKVQTQISELLQKNEIVHEHNLIHFVKKPRNIIIKCKFIIIKSKNFVKN
ncbi:hypothetical protein GPJ56_008143 [Histomonas meleagridis]|nr:hypothetical protein GPJ56_008143 [Histomonas meleagridis]